MSQPRSYLRGRLQQPLSPRVLQGAPAAGRNVLNSTPRLKTARSRSSRLELLEAPIWKAPIWSVSFQTRAASSRLELPALKALKAYRSSKQKLQSGAAGSSRLELLGSGAAAGFNLDLWRRILVLLCCLLQAIFAEFFGQAASGSNRELFD